MIRRFLLYLRRQSDGIKNAIVLSVSGLVTFLAILLWLTTDDQALNFKSLDSDSGKNVEKTTKTKSDYVDNDSSFGQFFSTLKEEVTNFGKEITENDQLLAEVQSTLESVKATTSLNSNSVAGINSTSSSSTSTSSLKHLISDIKNTRSATSTNDTDTDVVISPEFNKDTVSSSSKSDSATYDDNKQIDDDNYNNATRTNSVSTNNVNNNSKIRIAVPE